MEESPCLHCGVFFVPRNKKQEYCSLEKCQKARRAAWQNNKMKTDPEYRAGQKSSNENWLKNNPDYWRQYRENNPDKVALNRSLQRIRNKRRVVKSHSPPTPKNDLLAKMDARDFPVDKLSGQYWLVPVIAKMDAVKIYIHAVSNSYK
jgi:thioesterase domain-containing protein